MKPNKILAILLTVAMLATSLCLPAFAVDNGGEEVATVANDGATEITTADQFLSMAADGNYVLADDIALTASYAAAFSGTLDGADHTVTVTNGAVFTSLDGATVKNLNVGSKETPVSLTYAGTEEIKKGVLADYGAGATLEDVHLWATVDFTGATGAVRLGGFFGTVGDGDLSFEECSVNGSMTHTPTTALAQEHTVGCFIGYVPAEVTDCEINVESCTNNMSITDNNGATVGGVAGYVGSVAASGITVTVKDSLNTGDMNVTMNDADSNIGSFGGFVGSYTSVNSNLTMTNCVNKGDIKGLAGYFGGLAGSIGAGTNYVGVVEITDCVNYGEINGKRVGGVIGRANPYTDQDTSYCNITNCVNYGTAWATTRAGGIGASGNSHVNVTYCVNAGEVVTEHTNGSYVDAIWNTSKYVILKNNVTLTWAKVKTTVEDTSHDSGEALLSQTNEGAGVRIVLDGKGTGLRFKFTMDEATVNALKLLNAKAGAIFLPTELLVEGKDLTAENYANALVMEGNASEIKDGYYYASLVNLFENHYETEYSCQSFWRYQNADGEWVTVYANNTQSKTIKDVATEALAGDTSIYTAEQINLLNKYAAGNPTVEATN